MRGELQFNAGKISTNPKISYQYNPETGDPTFPDLCLEGTDGGMLYLVGENDWGRLMAEALVPLMAYARNVEEEINSKLNGAIQKPEVIILGKNDYRAFTILHRLRGACKLTEIDGVKIVEGSKPTGVELFGEQEKHQEDSWPGPDDWVPYEPWNN